MKHRPTMKRKSTMKRVPNMKQVPTVVKYAVFAAIATGINIAVQRGVAFFIEGPLTIYVSLLFGTIAGLVVKYLLDKRFIFYYRPVSLGDEAIKVFLYLVMSGFATVVFWAVEISFDALFGFDSARYLGAAVGLTLGYSLKYELDRRFVFVAKGSGEMSEDNDNSRSKSCSRPPHLSIRS
jgi:putative flippase GtrA